MYVLDVKVNSLREKGEMKNSRSVVIFQSANLLLRNVFQKRKRKNRPFVTTSKTTLKYKTVETNAFHCLLRYLAGSFQ